MAYSIEYFHPKVLENIESWPGDLLASHLRLVLLLAEHGPALLKLALKRIKELKNA
jgi:hypothetical protein